MIVKMKAPCSVAWYFDHKTRHQQPIKVVFDGNVYDIVRVGTHYVFREGRTLFHVFSVVSKSTFLKLVLNTENLAWEIQEMGDHDSN